MPRPASKSGSHRNAVPSGSPQTDGASTVIVAASSRVGASTFALRSRARSSLASKATNSSMAAVEPPPNPRAKGRASDISSSPRRKRSAQGASTPADCRIVRWSLWVRQAATRRLKVSRRSATLGGMTAHHHLSINLKCPSCGKVGTAKLSRANVDALPEGFHIGSEGGHRVLLYCSRCNVPAKTCRTPEGPERLAKLVGRSSTMDDEDVSSCRDGNQGADDDTFRVGRKVHGEFLRPRAFDLEYRREPQPPCRGSACFPCGFFELKIIKRLQVPASLGARIVIIFEGLDGPGRFGWRPGSGEGTAATAP